MRRWCTVTVVGANGERHSLDIEAESTCDAAHLYLCTVKGQAAARLPNRFPVPSVATVFEVVVEGRVYKVTGAALQRWIAKKRVELKGPKGALFLQRPLL